MKRCALLDTYVEFSQEAFEAVVDNLGAIGQVPSVVLMVPDIHWADAERVRQIYKCVVWNIPEQLLFTPKTWGVRFNGCTLLSSDAPETN